MSTIILRYENKETSAYSVILYVENYKFIVSVYKFGKTNLTTY